ncbi:MAG: phosphate acetyltransferase [Planctomycetes bacterium]|nr:phosphate acetyltransferase [Planctomycetota bacterium]
MNLFDSIKARVRPLGRRILLPETHDPRVVQAAVQCRQEGFCRPVLLAEKGRLDAAICASGGDVGAMEFLDPADPDRLDAFTETYYRRRRHKGCTLDEARNAVRDPVIYGALCVHADLVDGMVAGSASPTPHVIRAALHGVGTREGLKTLSSCFVLVLPRTDFGHEGVLLFSDCGVVPEPTEDQLVDIARSAASSWRQFVGTEPVVACLSFSTKRSTKHEAAQRMARVAQRVKDVAPHLTVDGELQVDAALVPEVARTKAPGSPVAGRANVLIFPNLEAGNIGYKLAERLGGGQAVGPIFQGLAKPINDLSRGCHVRDIVDAAAITCAQTLDG